MYNRIRLTVLFLLLLALTGATQNFSGLQNKKLVRVDDLGTSLESLLGGLGGGLDGSIDSVVVISDTEKELRFMLYYSGYTNGYFTLTTMNDARQREPMTTLIQIPPGIPSPIECQIKFDPRLSSVNEFTSSYLRIDIAKKENRPGKVKIFRLQKKWMTEPPPERAYQEVKLEPVGIAKNLGSVPKDFVPARRIMFETKYSEKIKTDRPLPVIRSGGGGAAYYKPFSLLSPAPDLTGTWNNTSSNSDGLIQLVITNTSMRSYKKCSPSNCDLGSSNLTPWGTDGYTTTVFYQNGVADVEMKLVGADLKVDVIQKLGFASKRTTHFTFVKQNMNFNAILLTDYVLMDWTKPTQPVSTEAQGPAIPLNLWNDIAVDPLVDFQQPQELSNININLFRDKNKFAGIYYIWPADYHLRWNESPAPEDGYDFAMLYGKQVTEMAETDPTAPVRFSATLTAGISPRERSVVKAILSTIDPYFKSIEYLPLKEVPEATFPESLNEQFGVPLDRITVNTSNDLTLDMKIAWRTNPDTKEFIQTALTSRQGISATVILRPKNSDIPELRIPASINLADNRSLGKMYLEPTKWRTRNWTNTTPYPMRLKYIHVMKRGIGTSNMIIYSWSINNLELPSGTSLSFDHSKIPAWLDTDPTSIMWIDYDVLPCSECDNKVLVSVTKGVFGSTLQQVRFTIPSAVFDTLNADYFLVTMRSTQADPKNEVLKELPALRIFKDPAKEFYTGPLYLAPNMAPAFEYRLTVVTRAGDVYKSNIWMPGTETDIVLGKQAVKEVFRGVIPGLE